MDLVIDPKVVGTGLTAGIVPAAGQAGIVCALNVCGDGVSNGQTVFTGQIRERGENIVIIHFVRFGCAGFL